MGNKSYIYMPYIFIYNICIYTYLYISICIFLPPRPASGCRARTRAAKEADKGRVHGGHMRESASQNNIQGYIFMYMFEYVCINIYKYV